MLQRAKTLVGQSAVYGLGNLLTQGIKFFLIPLYTQFLTPADYAILSVAGTFSSVMGILFQFGLRGAATRFHYDFLEDEEEHRAYYGTMWLFLMLAALSLALLIDWQGNALFHLLFRNVAFHPYGQLALWLSLATVASVIPLVLFRVREQALYYILFTVGRFLFTTLAIIFFVVALRQGAEGSLKGQLLVGVIFAVPFTVVALRNLRPTFHWDKLKASLAFGLPMVPHQLAGWALNVSDRILLTHYVSLDQLGLYSLGYRFGRIMDLILGSLNLAWAPFFYRTAVTEEDAPQTFARLTTYYAIFLLTLSLGMMLLSKDVIFIMAQPAFHDAHRVVPVIALAFVSHGFYYMVVNQLFFTKQTKNLPLFTSISAAVNIGLNLLTLSRFGIMAAAWNTVVGYVVLFVLVFRESARVYPIPYEYRRICVLFVMAGLVYLVGQSIALHNPYLNLIVKLLTVGAFPVLLFLVRFFTPREIKGMRLGLAKLRQRIGSKV